MAYEELQCEQLLWCDVDFCYEDLVWHANKCFVDVAIFHCVAYNFI
jgi:hypothetical protein